MSQESFQERLARINASKDDPVMAPATPGAAGVHVPDFADLQAIAPSDGQPRYKLRKPSKAQISGILYNARYPLAIALSFLLGMLTVVLARYARYHLFGLDPNGGGLEDGLFIDAGLSAALAFVIREAFDMKDPMYLSAKSAGITACVLTMHLAVHRWPGFWDMLFSVEWTDMVLDSTLPNGILFFSVVG